MNSFIFALQACNVLNDSSQQIQQTELREALNVAQERAALVSQVSKICVSNGFKLNHNSFKFN